MQEDRIMSKGKAPLGLESKDKDAAVPSSDYLEER